MLELPNDFVLPDYDGGTIGNIPATVAALTGVPFNGLPPLRDALWRPIAGDVRRVIVILLDGWGWNMVAHERSRLGYLLGDADIIGRITSVFPSTTVNALSSVWTGAAPSQHGFLGLRLLFPDQAAVGWTLSMGANFDKAQDTLVDAGVDLEQVLAWPGVGEQLGAAGVPTYAFKGRHIVDSSLSRMHGRGLAGNIGAFTMADMLVQMRDLLESKPGEPLFLNGYWPTIDTISHFRGILGPAAISEMHMLLRQIKAQLIDGLSPQARAGTALFLVADHGQIVAPQEQHVLVSQHPIIREMQLMRPAGESRVAYVYARQGQADALATYLNTQCDGRLLALSAETVLQSGLFGPEPYAPETRRRIGDLVVMARDRALYVNPDEEPVILGFNMFGHHGGLHPDEMYVPWVGFRLG